MRSYSRDASLVQGIQSFQPFPTEIENSHLGPQSYRHLCRMRPDDTGAEDHHLAWSHAGHPAQQDAAASLRPLQVVRSNLHRQPPGDLAHRPEDREASVRAFHGFVSDGEHPPIQQGFGQGPVGREMEIGEEGLAFPEDRILRGKRLLDLEDRKSTRLNSSHLVISYAVFCLKKKKT